MGRALEPVAREPVGLFLVYRGPSQGAVRFGATQRLPVDFLGSSFC
jgi:hypothetical protein